jgi:membrane fusion protein (multidrug efflux system)
MKKNFILAALALTIMGCKQANETETDKTPSIPVITVKQSNIVIDNSIVAHIQALKNVEVRSRIRGYLEGILVDEGKEVKKGQPLFKLSSPEYSAEFTKAQATLARAIAEEKASNLEVERVELLVSKNIVAKSELILAESKTQVAKAAVAEARATVKNAEAFLAYTTILAPFDGVINRIPLKIGSLVNEGDLLTSISDISSIYAYFHLPEAEYLKYQKAKSKGGNIPDEDNVQLNLADGSQYKYKGVIETVASEIEGSTGAIAFRARFANPEKIIKHGSSGSIMLKTDVENVIIIPQKSVLEIQDKNYVFVVDASNVVKMRNVVVGKRFGLDYLIQSGLAVNEKIVLEGVQSLREGNKIEAIQKSL